MDDAMVPFGHLVGVACGGVEAYSNNSPKHVSHEWNYVNGFPTGLKWQCVEFVRRWLVLRRGLLLPPIEIAADLWNLSSVLRLEDMTDCPLSTFRNGSEARPVVGDILVYDKRFRNTGHIAIVTAVDHVAGSLAIAEQNHHNTMWEQNYARTIPFVHEGNNVTLEDGSFLRGWKRPRA